MGLSLVAIDLQRQFGDYQSAATLLSTAIKHLCHQGILTQRIYLNLQMGSDIEMTHIESTAIGFAGILTGLVIVGLVMQFVNGHIAFAVFLDSIEHINEDTCVHGAFLGLLDKGSLKVTHFGPLFLILTLLIAQTTKLSLHAVIVAHLDILQRDLRDV